jgi:lipoate-protein ligase A
VSDALRIIGDDGKRDPRRNLALDEAVARAAVQEPVVRLWRNDRCVVVGRFQVAAAEVDAAAARRLGVPVYRRFTGGGSVYHDGGNLNVSLAAPRTALGVGTGGTVPEQLYTAVLEPLAAAMRSLGIAARPAPRGLFVGADKLGGVAAWVGGRSVLVHATILVDADLATLERVLAGPGAPDDPRWLRTRSERAPVTSIARLLGSSPTAPGLDALVDAAVGRAFASATARLGSRRVRSDAIAPTELAAAAALFTSRYADPAWHASGTLAERR